MLTNQKEVNATILGLKTNASANGRAVSTNTNAIAANKKSITTSNQGISSNSRRLSTLRSYPCNCRYNMNEEDYCTSATLSQGFGYYCKGASCKDSWSPVMDTKTGTGIRCCQLCMGTLEEAEAYARANPLPPAVYKECAETTVEPKVLQPAIL